MRHLTGARLTAIKAENIDTGGGTPQSIVNDLRLITALPSSSFSFTTSPSSKQKVFD